MLIRGVITVDTSTAAGLGGELSLQQRFLVPESKPLDHSGCTSQIEIGDGVQKDPSISVE